MKVVAIVQARMGSKRFPNKVMMPICGVPMIELLLCRLEKSKEVDQIVIATSIDEHNISLVTHVRNLGYACEQGSEDDVLDRYIHTARAHQADVIVRITGDCPLVDPGLVDQVIRAFKVTNVTESYIKILYILHFIFLRINNLLLNCFMPLGGSHSQCFYTRFF